jgi:HK97 family phage major capsid protein
MPTKREQIEQLTAQMKARAAEIDSKTSAATPEELEEINKMGADVKALIDTFKAEASLNGTIDVAKAFLSDLAGVPSENTDSAPEVHPTGIVNPKGMTLGEAFVKSPAFEEFLAYYKGEDGKIRNVSGIRSKGFAVAGFGGDAKALITGVSSTSGGAFVINDRYGPVADQIGERTLTVRSLCTNITTQSDTFEFVQITAKTNNAAAVLEATTNADPAAPAPAGAEITAGGYKPESDMTFAVVSTPVETIAHLMALSRRAAADAGQVMEMVNAFLLYGLSEEEEDQILNGNGTTPNLRGILQTVGISTVGSAGTDLDAIVDAIRTIRADRREPTAMVVHPNDWYSTGFLLAKDTTGQYLVGDPRSTVDQLNSLWGLKVVVTPAMTENTVLVGDFRQAVIADRQQSTIYMTDSHKDWFGRNLLAVLAEERLALGVLDVDAFCTVTAV